MKLVVHNKDERQGLASDKKEEQKPEPPTGVLIFFD